jgi:hypothetical protein
VLVVIVMPRGDDARALKERPLLAGFDAAKVTRLQVFSGKDAKPVDLVKRDASWVVTSAFDYPADQAKITEALSPIAKLAAAEPMATQAGRHKQLHVADTDFERKLVITVAGKDVTLYLGSPAGARRAAVRIGGDDKVFAVAGISAAAVGSEPRQWVDTSYVKIAQGEIAKVIVQRDGKTVELARPAQPPEAAGSGAGSDPGAGSAATPSPPADEHWNVAVGGAPITLATGESLDEEAVNRLVGEVATIDLSAPADPKRDASKPTATVTIERKATGTATPAPTILDVIADGSSYWVHDRSLSRAVLVDKARLDNVLGAERDKLIKKPPPPTAISPGAGSGAAPPPGPVGSLPPGPG